MEKSISELLEFCIINADKPAGMTSFDVCDKIRKIFNAKKAGHTGTLDPMVTGVLPVLLNRATKLSGYFMKKDKEYIGKMHLHSDISRDELKKYMDEFVGKIMQKPPVRSRVKRVFRERTVNKFKIIKKQGRVVEFESDVEAGTYIRKLISDLGEKIGGAHMTELRRTRAGIFLEKDLHTMENLEKAAKEWKEKGDETLLRKILIPAEIVQKIVARLDVTNEAVGGLLNGKPLLKNDLENNNIPDSDLFSVFCKEKFIGIYKKADEKNIIARAEFVMS